MDNVVVICNKFYENVSGNHGNVKDKYILGDSWNYMPPILVPSSAKRIATQILLIAKLNEREYFILGGLVCDIIRPYKELSIQS